MNNAQKMNLRKLNFLGFKSPSSSNDGNSNDGEPQLDEECAKVFAMDTDVNAFDIHKFHDVPPAGEPRQYGEKEYMQHRKRSYPHMHAPLKHGTKSMRRRSSNSQSTPNSTPVSGQRVLSTDGEPAPDSPPTSYTTDPPQPSDTPLGSHRSKAGDSDTGQLNSEILEESDGAESEDESESECVLSDPCSYRGGADEEVSPERKVSFLNENKDTFDVDGLTKDRKKRRHHHSHHAKFRKYSLPDDPKARKRHHQERRVSTQPEDQFLRGADQDQLDSHRSDDPRALRRHRTSRPSNASLMHIGKGAELHPSLKKLYDHSPHAIFVELDELFTTNDEREWKETARWIKYEEDVEEGVDRWGKPHVASLSFHSLLNLRKCLEDGVVCLDMEEKDLPAIAYRVTEELFKEEFIREEDKGKIIRALLLRHRHVNEPQDRGFRFPKKQSYTSLQSLWLEDGVNYDALMMARCSVCSAQGQLCAPHALPRLASYPHNLHDAEKRKISFPILDNLLKNGDTDHTVVDIKDIKEETYSASTEELRKTNNDSILRKIPAGAQGSSVLVGEVDFLEQPAIAFIRLAEGVVIPSIIEVNIPVRFIFMLLGPKIANIDYHEVGRSISTLMANQQFHNIAYGANDRKALLSAINEFLDDSIVLPPGDWERQALLPIEEIKAKSEAIRRRKENALKKAAEAQGISKPLLAVEGDGEKKPPYPNPLERTRRPWGGLINDLKRRYPHYVSDVVDGINPQCFAASIFMYFAAVSGAIAFGGLMGDKTQNLIGIPETLLSTSVAGLIFAILSGQPLVIVGTTGGLLLFDESLFQFCESSNLEFLTTRVYISLWLVVIGVVVACVEGSVFVKLFTRFTEDIFSALIVLLYILEALMKVMFIYGRHPLLSDYCETESGFMNGSSSNSSNETELVPIVEKVQTLDKFGPVNQPNTALFCTILTLGTFIIAYYLKMFRNSKFLGRSARRALGDFGVPIAIVFMVFVDYMTPAVFTEKLNVPQGMSPTEPDKREWFISPEGRYQPVPTWVIFASAVPALLVYILLFMETHITELIIDKKERKLKKGSGFHVDIVLLCFINLLSGFLGMPWMCAATVRSITHVSALTVMSTTHAPGEKPYLVEVKEQRLSAFLVALLIGLSVLMSPLLRLVPMAVLFGVFLYMGVASIDGIQFFDRIKLLFMPVKHHPNTMYVRRVKTVKMHLFTFVQLMCLVVLWIVKSTKASLAFPFFLILMVPLRAQLKHVFSQTELRALDGDQVDVEDDEPDFYAEAPLPG
ncbi:band 3 anion transport protein isoform X3 [Aethina tumida]|uniref:band 3 anion transport protein isoform X3 n=1 Tax=Aethina tumida TaxID=116153 RepID=UPI0021493BA4|nr:band 3 anion transport protein isoform X3 [Aethina tumida]XP_049819811.1 band 3 anion transport protein isoform X3 [Aethina tumida]